MFRILRFTVRIHRLHRVSWYYSFRRAVFLNDLFLEDILSPGFSRLCRYRIRCGHSCRGVGPVPLINYWLYSSGGSSRT